MNKPPTLRQRLANFLGGDPRKEEVARLEKFNELLRQARDYTYSPETILRQIGEGADSQFADLLIRQRSFIPLIGQGAGGVAWSEQDRLSAVSDSRYMAHYDVMTSRAIKLWTNFGFGQHVKVLPKDDEMKDVWEECFYARRNRPVFGQRKIKRLSNDVLVDGEFLFIATTSKLDGRVTFRRMATDKIAAIIHEDGDPDIPLYYVQNASVKVGEGLTARTYSAVWYADWQTTEEQLAAYHETHPMPADAINASDIRKPGDPQLETEVLALHVAFNEYAGRGWPQLRRTADWARAYRNFLQDRASVAAAVALYVDKIKMTASQRQVDSMVSSLQSTLALGNSPGYDRNPPPAAGATWVENQAVDRQRMSQGTAAGDAQIDGASILGQFAAGADVPLIWLERPDVAGNFAVARQSVLPWYEVVQSYQADWMDIFSDLVELVGRMWNKYGGGSIEEYSCEVLLDSPFEADISETGALMGAITSAVAGGSLDAGLAKRATERLTVLALTALGVRDVSSITEPDAAPVELPEAMQRAMTNLAEGRITVAQFSEFAKLQAAEVAQVGASGAAYVNGKRTETGAGANGNGKH